MKANPREPRLCVTLRGGPADGQEFVITRDMLRHGILKVPAEREQRHAYLADPFEIPTVSFAVAIYERSRVPGRWTFARMEGER
jgi:hypothetical protein